MNTKQIDAALAFLGVISAMLFIAKHLTSQGPKA